MTRIRWLLAAVAAAVTAATPAAAQEAAVVSGRVTGPQGAPENAVLVRIDALNVGTTTGPDGSYRLVVPASRIRAGQQVQVRASRVGLQPRSQAASLASGAAVTLNFQMASDALRLSEVVVTGAGTESRGERLGTVRASVDAATVERTNESNVITALAGKVPGVVTTQSSGEAGASTAIRIRGTKTITGTGQPLVVVDGVPILNTTRSTTGSLQGTVSRNPASDINPADIENIEILKGPAASAIYGAAAGTGGAILITTRRGRPGVTRYSLRSSMQMDRVSGEVPLQSTYGVGTGGNSTQCTAVNCAISSGFFSWGPRLAEGTPTFDHFNEMFETGRILDNTLTVSGGSDRTTFYLSLGGLTHDGFYVSDRDKFERYTVRFNGSHQVSGNVRVGANIAYAQTEGSFHQRGNSVNGTLLGALRQPTEFDAKNYITQDGFHRSWRFPNPGAGSALSNRGFDNPFYAMYEGANTAESGRVYGNANAEWQALDWLKVNYTLGGDFSSDDRLEARPYQSSGSPVAGSVARWQFSDRILDHNLTATASYTLGSIATGSLVMGQNLNEQRFRQVFVTGNSLIAPTPLKLSNTTDRSPPTDAETTTRSEGYFLQGTMDLGDELFLTAAVRNDGSSTFGRSNNRAWYPKASAAWTFTDRVTFPGGYMDFGKLRVAYGESGQIPNAYNLQDIFTNAALLDFNPGSTLAPTLGGLGGLYTAFQRGNADIKPERNSEMEMGFDLGLFGQRADLSVTYYDAQSRDVIYAVPFAPSSGYTSQVANAGEISNKGWEVSLNTRLIQRGDFSLTLGGNWSRNRNEVLSLGDSLITVTGYSNSFSGSTTNVVVGEPLGVFRGQDFARCGRGLGMIGTNNVGAACQGQPDGALYLAANGRPIQDPTDRTIGDPNPNWTAGFNAQVTFRKLQLSAFLDVREGGEILNMTRSSLYQYGTHRDTERRGESVVFGETYFNGQPTVGPGAGVATTLDESWFTGLGSVGGPRAQFMEDASFKRLREVSASYVFDQPWVQRRLGLSSFEATVSGRNLKLWTDYTGVDPEINLGGASAANRGIDWFTNPLSRAWVFSITLNR